MGRWRRRILIVLLAFVLAPVAFYFYIAWQGERELRAVLAELDAHESPWRVEDLEAARKHSPGLEDVRPLIAKIHSQMPSSFGNKIYSAARARIHPHVLLSADDYEVHLEELAPVQEALLEARKLAGMPHGRLHVPWGKDFLTWKMEEIQHTRMVANLLQTSAVRYAHQGDLDLAMEDCLAGQRTAQLLQDEHLLVAQLVRMAVQAIALWSLEITLGHGQPSPEQLARLQKAWEEFDTEAALKNGYVGERAGCHRMFEEIAAGKISLNDMIGAPKGVGGPTLLDRGAELYLRSNLKQAHAWSLRHWSAAIKSLDLPEAERSARWDELNELIWKAPGAARMLMPAMHKVADAHRRTESRTRAAIAALAAERFRRDHDRWPKTMAELCPKYLRQVLNDPYTGAPLGWRPTGDGIVIYSVGPDGKQRGDYQEEVAKGAGGVLSYEFRLWNVPQRRLVAVREP